MLPFFGSSGLMSALRIPDFIRLFWRLYRDRRVWFLPKFILFLGVLYTVSPVDLIPGFPLVFLGWLDDIVVLFLSAKAFLKLSPNNVVYEHVRLIDEGG